MIDAVPVLHPGEQIVTVRSVFRAAERLVQVPGSRYRFTYINQCGLTDRDHHNLDKARKILAHTSEGFVTIDCFNSDEVKMFESHLSPGERARVLFSRETLGATAESK